MIAQDMITKTDQKTDHIKLQIQPLVAVGAKTSIRC